MDLDIGAVADGLHRVLALSVTCVRHFRSPPLRSLRGHELTGQARWACRSSSMASIALGFAGLEPARLVPLAALHGEASRSFESGCWPLHRRSPQSFPALTDPFSHARWLDVRPTRSSSALLQSARSTAALEQFADARQRWTLVALQWTSRLMLWSQYMANRGQPECRRCVQPSGGGAQQARRLQVSGSALANTRSRLAEARRSSYRSHAVASHRRLDETGSPSPGAFSVDGTWCRRRQMASAADHGPAARTALEGSCSRATISPEAKHPR